MCGIAGIHRRTDESIDKMGSLVNQLLYGIESRGRDATGLLAIGPDGSFALDKRILRATDFIATRKGIHSTAKTILLHTRYATKGAKELTSNAHPLVSGKVAAVHNGMIYNDDEIFRTFDLPRAAQVDSEVIPAIINFSGWDSAEDGLDLLDGSAAIAAVTADRPDELLLVRTESSPLVYMVTRDLVVFASTRGAIETAWRIVYGKKAQFGTFTTMPEWTSARINGEITTKTIRVVDPAKKVFRQRDWRLDGGYDSGYWGKRTEKSWPTTPKKTPKKTTGGRKLNREALAGSVVAKAKAINRRMVDKSLDFLIADGWTEQELMDILTERMVAEDDADFDLVFRAEQRHDQLDLAASIASDFDDEGVTNRGRYDIWDEDADDRDAQSYRSIRGGHLDVDWETF